MDFPTFNIWMRLHVFSFLMASGVFIFVSFFDESHVRKQNSARWNAAFCGVISGAILFANVQYKRTTDLYGLKEWIALTQMMELGYLYRILTHSAHISNSKVYTYSKH